MDVRKKECDVDLGRLDGLINQPPDVSHNTRNQEVHGKRKNGHIKGARHGRPRERK